MSGEKQIAPLTRNHDSKQAQDKLSPAWKCHCISLSFIVSLYGMNVWYLFLFSDLQQFSPSPLLANNHASYILRKEKHSENRILILLLDLPTHLYLCLIFSWAVCALRPIPSLVPVQSQPLRNSSVSIPSLSCIIDFLSLLDQSHKHENLSTSLIALPLSLIAHSSSLWKRPLNVVYIYFLLFLNLLYSF